MPAPTLTANVIPAGFRRRKRIRRASDEPRPGPDKYVTPDGITHLVGSPVLVTMEVFGIRQQYRGSLQQVICANDKSAGIQLSCPAHHFPHRKLWQSLRRVGSIPVFVNWPFVINVQPLSDVDEMPDYR